ncbi:MAG: hypothetical protein JWL58_7236 [Streptosporangiaceae bacterium]|nr:hypothetical protein [Streptosporangiaceae bacterium]
MQAAGSRGRWPGTVIAPNVGYRPRTAPGLSGTLSVRSWGAVARQLGTARHDQAGAGVDDETVDGVDEWIGEQRVFER